MKGAPSPLVEIIEGDFIDLRDDLDAGAIGRPEKKETPRVITDVAGVAPELRSPAWMTAG